MYTKPPIQAAPSTTKTPKDQAPRHCPEKTLKKWTPSPKLKAVFPNTWMPPKEPAKPGNETPAKLSKLTKYKQRISMLTSTPNMSMDAGAPKDNEKRDQALTESVIENEAESNKKMNASTKTNSPAGSKNGSVLKNSETSGNLNSKLSGSMLEKTLADLDDEEIEGDKSEKDDEDDEDLGKSKQV